MQTTYIKSKKKNEIKEDKVFNRVLVVFAVTVVIEVLLLIIYRRFYVAGPDSVHVPFETIKWVFAVLFVLAAIGAAIMLNRKKSSVSRNLAETAVLMLLLSASCYFLSHHGLGAAKLLSALFPAAMVIYIFMLVYQREFFICSLLCAGAIVTVASMKNYNCRFNMITISAAAATAVLAIAFAVIAIAAGKDGRIRLGKMKAAVFEMRGGRVIIFASCLIALAAAVIALAGAEALFEPFIYIAAAAVFVSAVYHTAKLM